MVPEFEAARGVAAVAVDVQRIVALLEPVLDAVSAAGGAAAIQRERQRGYDNEVYRTNYRISLVKNMLCSKFHRQKGFILILFLCRILVPVRSRGRASDARVAARDFAILVEGLGFRVLGFGFRVKSAGFKVEVLGVGCRV